RRPDVVPQVDRDYWRGVILGQRDEESVRQTERFDRNAHRSKLHWSDEHRNPDTASLAWVAHDAFASSHRSSPRRALRGYRAHALAFPGARRLSAAEGRVARARGGASDSIHERRWYSAFRIRRRQLLADVHGRARLSRKRGSRALADSVGVRCV